MFLQIAELRVPDREAAFAAVRRAEDHWRAATVGRRTAVAERLYLDRDAPGRYLAVNEFASHELAMENSNLPETSAMATEVGRHVEILSYRNLDLVLDMRADELEGLADALVEVFATGRLDPVAFAGDVLFDINLPQWRFQLKGRSEVEHALREQSPDGSQVVARRMLPAATALVLEIVTSDHDGGGMSRQLCLAGLDRGRIVSVVIYCTGRWDREVETRHAAEVVLHEPGFV